MEVAHPILNRTINEEPLSSYVSVILKEAVVAGVGGEKDRTCGHGANGKPDQEGPVGQVRTLVFPWGEMGATGQL